MKKKQVKSSTAVEALNKSFLLNYPEEAARKLGVLSPKEAAKLFSDLPTYVLLPVWSKLLPGVASNILLHLSKKKVVALLESMNPGLCATLLSRFNEKKREHFFSLLDKTLVLELRELLQYPEESAGNLMDTDIIAFNENMSVQDALIQLRHHKIKDLHYLFLLNDHLYLTAQVPVQRLVLAQSEEKLSAISIPLQSYVTVLDKKNEIMEKLEKFKIDTIPVIDLNNHFVGIIYEKKLLGVLKETLATEMLTMVGASKDERALSSVWFAVKKRLPWLEINLLTAFLASAVVGMFEGTIAKYTALAILLPIAAGQSGNTGAQALAVTMRGLALREIMVRHWIEVLRKEAAAALINGVAVAITCGAGVYLWSKSSGLACIIALAMLSSMLIAAISGALVPIVLKKLGQDPALSSSIILTTITDIAGFISFLGIATMLSFLL